jgi:hypothetical protein
MNSKGRPLIQLVLGWLIYGACATFAQAPRAEVTGIITDSSKAVAPDAAVIILDLEKGVERKTTSNELGYYRIPLLEPGKYRMTVQKPGFKPVTRAEIVLEVDQVARIDFVLEVGEVMQRVEVQATALLIQSETTEVGQVIDNKRIVEMPLNGRNYLELAQFAVGVLPARQVGKGSRSAQDDTNYMAVGVHAYQNVVLLDGNDNSSRASGGPLGSEAQAVIPPVDSVAEFKVVTNNTSAEYGYRLGGKTLVSTKSGTNELHGSLYEFLRNDQFDGTNFFANRAGRTKPTYRQNQFGGTVGGRVIKNRTFFFGSYQGTRIRLGESYVSTVPSAAVHNGDFSQQPVNRRNIFDPLTITGTGAAAERMPFSNNRIPASRFDPVTKTVIDVYPLPNIAGRDNLPNNYFFAPSDSNDANQYDFRVDHYISNSERMFVRYSRRRQFVNQPGVLPMPADGGTAQTTILNGDNVAMNLSSTINAKTINEFRFGYSHFPTRYDIPYTENLNQKFGIKGAPGDTLNDGLNYGWTQFVNSDFTTIGSIQDWPNINHLDNLLIADSLVIQRGSHSLKFGGEYRRSDIIRLPNRKRRGVFTFTGVYTAQDPNVGSSRASTGNGMADMLLGWPIGILYGFPQGEDVISPYHALFIQDDWKITPRLTMNIGLRWELFLAPKFPDLSTFPNKTVSRYLIPEINNVSVDTLVFPKNSGDSGAAENYKNFAPRLGVAYRLTNQWVLRAGAGLYYGQADYISSEAARFYTQTPGIQEPNITEPNEATTIFVKDAFPPLVINNQLQPNNSISAALSKKPDLTSSQWFLDVQRNLPSNTLLTVSYNGTSTWHMAKTRNLNQPLTPNATVPAAQRRPRPFFSSVSDAGDPMLRGHYEALTVKAEKRFSHGVTFLSSFTWSHNIDYAAENLEAGAPSAAWDRSLSLERASSDLNRALGYNLSAVYELPAGRGRRWLRSGPASWMLGGWQVGGILALLSGMPVSHTLNVDNQNLGGAVRGDWLTNTNLPDVQRTIDHWFNTSFVGPSAPSVISNAGRNVIIGPGKRNIDIVLSRTFPMPWEAHRLQFRFESFNFTNTPHFWGAKYFGGNSGRRSDHGGRGSAEDSVRVEICILIGHAGPVGQEIAKGD